MGKGAYSIERPGACEPGVSEVQATPRLYRHKACCTIPFVIPFIAESQCLDGSEGAPGPVITRISLRQGREQ